MGKDLLVNLYDLPSITIPDQCRILRLLSPDADRLGDFVRHHFGAGWASEIKAGAYRANPTVFMAVDALDNIVGFAAYDCTAKGFFGPTGVLPEFRGKGLGAALLLTALYALKNDGYAYAIIGDGEEKFGFYHRVAKAVLIDGGPTVYSRMLTR